MILTRRTPISIAGKHQRPAGSSARRLVVAKANPLFDLAQYATESTVMGSFRDANQRAIQVASEVPNALKNTDQSLNIVGTAISSSVVLGTVALFFGLTWYFYATRDSEDVRDAFNAKYPSQEGSKGGRASIGGKGNSRVQTAGKAGRK